MSAARDLARALLEKLEAERQGNLAQVERLRIRAAGRGPDAADAREALEAQATAAFARLRPRPGHLGRTDTRLPVER